jgi:glycosyltransferase involved in cell wall biosynthesis
VRGELLVVNTSSRYEAICDELAKLGWHTRVYEPPESNLFKAYTIVRSFRPSLRNWKKSRVRVANRLSRTAWMFRYSTRRAAKMIRQRVPAPDIVLQIGAWLDPYRPANVPYTVFCDCTVKLGEIDPSSGVDFPSPLTASRWYAAERSVYENAAFVFPSSEFVKKSLVQDYGVEPDRVVPVGSAPNLKAPDLIERDYLAQNILFVGYEFERKGGLVLLDAFRKVLEVFPNARLWIVGPRRLDYALPAGAQLLGSLSAAELSNVYQRASVFVMPSLFEPFGIAPLEAMDHRLPCIGSDRCAMPEIITHGETGFVSPAGDAEALSRHIIHLFHRPDLMRQMGAAGRAKVQRQFTWPAVARKIDEKLLHLR